MELFTYLALSHTIYNLDDTYEIFGTALFNTLMTGLAWMAVIVALFAAVGRGLKMPPTMDYDKVFGFYCRVACAQTFGIQMLARIIGGGYITWLLSFGRDFVMLILVDTAFRIAYLTWPSPA